VTIREKGYCLCNDVVKNDNDLLLPSLISAEGLCKRFFVRGRPLQAVRNFSFSIYPNEILGLTGESGCGKSTLAYLLTGFLKPDQGKIWFRGRLLSRRKKNHPDHRKIQYLFQESSSALNPYMTVRDSLLEPLHLIKKSPNEKDQTIRALLHSVDLPSEYLFRFPHELSGGERQKVGMVRALVSSPPLLIFDEPMASLDPSVRSRIANFLLQVKEEYELTYLFISHDLAMIRYLSHRVAVMYRGYLVEVVRTQDLHHHPLHPYTQALFSSDLSLSSPRAPQRVSNSTLSSFPHHGCPFVQNCPHAFSRCWRSPPPWTHLSETHHLFCHLSVNQLDTIRTHAHPLSKRPCR